MRARRRPLWTSPLPADPPTGAQVALQWLIQKEHVLPIPGAKSKRQAAGNAGALSFTLADAEIEALDQATTAWRR
jgi:diketogulonate reductase-like aldo/keto reductase